MFVMLIVSYKNGVG